MVYVIVFNFLFNLTIFTFGIMLLKKDTPGKKQSRKDYLSPGLIACIAAFGIYWFQIQLPEEIETLAGYYGNACTLLSMIVIGISLAGMKAKDTLKNKRLLAFVFIRFIVFPYTVGSGPQTSTVRSVDKSSGGPDGCSSGRKFFSYALRTVRKRSQAHCRGDRSDYDLIGIYHYSDFYAGIIVGAFVPNVYRKERRGAAALIKIEDIYTFDCSVCAALSLWPQSYARQIRIKCINIPDI